MFSLAVVLLILLAAAATFFANMYLQGQHRKEKQG